MKNNRPLTVFSTQAWSDLWVSKHWIAHELAQDRRVLFVEPPARLPLTGGVVGALSSPVRRVTGELWALQPVTLPFPYRVPALARVLWRYPLHRQLARALSELGFDCFDVLTFDPHCQPLIAPFKDRVRRLVYYAVDPPLGREDLFWPERRLVRNCDSVLAVTRRLADLLTDESGRHDINVLPHGISAESASAPVDDAPIPKAFASVDWGRPVIGYTGAIHDVCVDFSLIKNTALSRPKWQFVFIGPYAGSALARQGFDIGYFADCPNVIFCGAVPFVELKHAIRMFDVCIVPYRADVPNNWERRSPFKILHYFAQGKPVVMSNVPALSDYSANLIYGYETAEEFIAALAHALEEPHDSDLRRQRKALSQERSFENLLLQMQEHFE